MSVFTSLYAARPDDEEDYGPSLHTASGNSRLPVHPWLWVGLSLVLLLAAMMMLMVLAFGVGTTKQSQPGNSNKLLPKFGDEEPAVPTAPAR